MRSRRILSILLCLSLVFALAVPVYAADDGIDESWGETVYYTSVAPLFDMLQCFYEDVDELGDAMWDGMQQDFIDSVLFWKELYDAVAYDDYVNDLPSGLDSTSSGTTAFGTLGVAFATTEEEKLLADEFWASVDLYNLAASAEIGEELLVSKIYSSSSIYFAGLCKVHNSYFGFDMLTAQYPCSQNMSPYTSADFPLGTFCLFGSSSVTSSSSSICYYSSTYKFVKSVFLNYSDAVSAYVTSPKDLFYLRPDTRIVPVFWEGSTTYPFRFRWENLGFISASGEVSTYSGDCLYVLKGGSYYCYVYPSYPAIVDVGDDYDSTTRVSTVTNIFNEYNTTNNYVDNSVVNYYIGTVDESNNVTNIYNINIYNEDTLVFTEPVTGAQYQSTGWTYDYTTRCYDIALDAGTFTINDTDVTQILCTYGDEAVTIDYYDASGNALQSDEYSYVMVSGSECSLTGHAYNVETIKEATCTSAGERLYTCSVCGDQYVEDIPMEAHAFAFSILKEATCTESGIGLYSCSSCGTEYTESIEALGHDWLQQDSVATTYTLPEGTSCPDCAGTEFTEELDEEHGTCLCVCSSCETQWSVEAEITYGYTSYTCSRCGETKTESDDGSSGLFESIGDFVANGISWITEKLSLLIDTLGTITDTYNEYLDTVIESTGEFPTLLGEAISLMPQDFMAVVWFSVIALVMLAVWLKWFH